MSSLYSCKKLIKYFYKTKVFENISFDIEKNSDLNNLFPHMLPKKEKFLSFLKKLSSDRK